MAARTALVLRRAIGATLGATLRTALTWTVWLAGPCAAGASAQDIIWLHELETNPKLLGREITVEGRYSGRVGQNLDKVKLKNSSVEFRVVPSQAERLPSSTRFVRLVGTLNEVQGKLVMQVKSITHTTNTDADRYGAAASRIGSRDHRAWYALADRVRSLAEFQASSPEL